MPPRREDRQRKRRRVAVPIATGRDQHQALPSAANATPLQTEQEQEERQKYEDRHENSECGIEEDSGYDDKGTGSNPQNQTETDRDEALKLILGSAQVTKGNALKALETTSQHSVAGPQVWAEEAMCELAVLQECYAEIDLLGAAMEVSLMEAEVRKSNEKPLMERNPKELNELFVASEMLRLLQVSVGNDQLLEGGSDLKQLLLDYLDMERNCKKWYNTSMVYFSDAATRAVNSIAAARGGPGASVAEPATTTTASGSKSPINDQTANPSTGNDDRANKDIGWEVVLGSFLEVELEKLRKEVYSRPKDDCDTVPTIFKKSKTDEVVLIE